VFPSAIREVVNTFAPMVSGVVSVRPAAKGVKQAPPLKVVVELAEGVDASDDLRARIEHDIRATLVVSTAVHLTPAGTLPRSEYKSKLLDYSDATTEKLDG
jgi:phenylacetate-CoA ligase